MGKNLVQLGVEVPLPQRSPGNPQYSLPLGADGIQLINEDDGWCLLLGQGKGIPNQLSTISNEHLYQLGTGQLEEGGLKGRWHG